MEIQELLSKQARVCSDTSDLRFCWNLFLGIERDLTFPEKVFILLMSA